MFKTSLKFQTKTKYEPTKTNHKLLYVYCNDIMYMRYESSERIGQWGKNSDDNSAKLAIICNKH